MGVSIDYIQYFFYTHKYGQTTFNSMYLTDNKLSLYRIAHLEQLCKWNTPIFLSIKFFLLLLNIQFLPSNIRLIFATHCSWKLAY